MGGKIRHTVIRIPGDVFSAEVELYGKAGNWGTIVFKTMEHRDCLVIL